MKNVRYYLIAVIFGIFTGGLTLIGQKYLPVNFNFLANAGAVWLVPAFLISYFSKLNKGHSIGLCVVCLLLCINSYYISESIMNGHEFSFTGWQIIWTVMAFIVGSVFGFGAYFSNSDSGPIKYCGMNLLPAVFFQRASTNCAI